jgi:hypothetical protein
MLAYFWKQNQTCLPYLCLDGSTTGKKRVLNVGRAYPNGALRKLDEIKGVFHQQNDTSFHTVCFCVVCTLQYYFSEAQL